MSQHASYLKLERYRLQELGAAEARAVSEHLAGCDACQACWAEVERELELPELPELQALGAERRPAAGDLIELTVPVARCRLQIGDGIDVASGDTHVVLRG